MEPGSVPSSSEAGGLGPGRGSVGPRAQSWCVGIGAGGVGAQGPILACGDGLGCHTGMEQSLIWSGPMSFIWPTGPKP